MPRRLGQHFLKDKKVLRKIAATLEINPRDVIVEIGSGHGELTEYILRAKPKKIIAIERDPRLVNFLKENFQNIKVVEGDILKILLTPYSAFDPPAGGRNSKLTGNIPYYLTGFLFRKIGELEKKPKLIVFTIQREVAERICAAPPRMNLLAASIQFWGMPKIIARISKRSFSPPPKVDSAIIRIIPRHKQPPKEEAGKYYRFIRILFKQPRKTVLNNLREGFKLPLKEVEEKLKTLRVSPKSRAANLSMVDINKLSRIFGNKRV